MSYSYQYGLEVGKLYAVQVDGTGWSVVPIAEPASAIHLNLVKCFGGGNGFGQRKGDGLGGDGFGRDGDLDGDLIVRVILGG